MAIQQLAFGFVKKNRQIAFTSHITALSIRVLYTPYKLNKRLQK